MAGIRRAHVDFVSPSQVSSAPYCSSALGKNCPSKSSVLTILHGRLRSDGTSLQHWQLTSWHPKSDIKDPFLDLALQHETP